MFGFSKDAIWAFGVHLLTSSGAFLAFLSLVAAAENRFVAAFFWLGAALAVDGVDGPLARKLEVKKWWPHWSGDMLDSVIDYVTYVIIPAFILYQSGLMGRHLSFLSAALIVTTSAIYYADTRMKTADNGFKGFPICWNMVVFTMFVVSPSEYFSLAVVVLSAVLTFVPVIFVHPVRVKQLRPLTLGIFAAWSAGSLAALVYQLDPPIWIDGVILASGLYLYCIGFVLQLAGRVR